MTKQEKVNLINEYLKKSETAQRDNARAIILPDGRIEYQITKRYTMKVSFSKIINYMNGKDIRQLYAKIQGKTETTIGEPVI